MNKMNIKPYWRYVSQRGRSGTPSCSLIWLHPSPSLFPIIWKNLHIPLCIKIQQSHLMTSFSHKGHSFVPFEQWFHKRNLNTLFLKWIFKHMVSKDTFQPGNLKNRRVGKKYSISLRRCYLKEVKPSCKLNHSF